MVAISIPIFSSQLEKAREATDLANIRSAYAECSADILTESSDTASGVTYDADAGTATKTVKLEQQKNGWQTTNPNCAGVTLTDDIAKKGGSVKVTVHADGSAPDFEAAE